MNEHLVSTINAGMTGDYLAELREDRIYIAKPGHDRALWVASQAIGPSGSTETSYALFFLPATPGPAAETVSELYEGERSVVYVTHNNFNEK